MLRSITKPKPAQDDTPKHLSDCMAFISGHIPTGICVTISSNGVRASMGNQQFHLSQNRYELQADIEAMCRLVNRIA